MLAASFQTRICARLSSTSLFSPVLPDAIPSPHRHLARRRNASSIEHVRAMSKLWSENPNAPYFTYSEEKAAFAGGLVSSLLYGTSVSSPSTHPQIRAHFGCLADTSYHCRAVLSMYDRAAWPCSPRRGRDRMGTRLLHRDHVLVRDRGHCNRPAYSTHFLHR